MTRQSCISWWETTVREEKTEKKRRSTGTHMSRKRGSRTSFDWVSDTHDLSWPGLSRSRIKDYYLWWPCDPRDELRRPWWAASCRRCARILTWWKGSSAWSWSCISRESPGPAPAFGRIFEDLPEVPACNVEGERRLKLKWSTIWYRKRRIFFWR